MDLCQILMHPVDIEKMAVMAPFGLFKFNCLPFGLHNADSTLQRMVDCVLANLHFALPTEMTSLWPDAITWNISFISAGFWSACSILVWSSTAATSVFSARHQQAFWAIKCSSRALFKLHSYVAVILDFVWLLTLKHL
jgi:hypothetical protein